MPLSGLVLDLSKYLDRRFPEHAPAMRQRWDRLVFIHYAVPPDLLRPHIPPELEVDTFPDESGEEMAWIGIVAFAMRGVRFIGAPAIPTASNFLETNVRTYVHHQGREPGVWFFSLDASSILACAGARLSYGLPYYHSDMREAIRGDRVGYSLRRYDEPQAEARIAYSFLPGLRHAEPGTLDYFLVERYRLYSIHRGQLMTGTVRHTAYPVASLSELEIESNLLESLGLPTSPLRHACFSPGVEVEVWGIEAV